MTIYNVEISSKVEDEIMDAKLFTFVDEYGDGWEEEWVKWADTRLKMHHQYTVFMDHLLIKIVINDKIKCWQDYSDISREGQDKYRNTTVKTIMNEYYDEWYAGKWKNTGESRLTPTIVTGYMKKSGPLVVTKGGHILNIRKK